MFAHFSALLAHHADAAVFILTTTMCAVGGLLLPLVG